MPAPPLKYDLTQKRIWVAGHRGMVGSALVKRLEQENAAEVLTVSRDDLDLIDSHKVSKWVSDNKPDAIIIAAAKVGGIHANRSYQADFLYQNLMIASNIIHAAHTENVEKLLYLGSSCIYPRNAPQPIEEASLLTGLLEPTNEGYAIAKIAGIKLCQMYRRQYGRDFIAAMPTNLYGPGDNYHPENSHVIPALIRKAHNAKFESSANMEVWGTGKVRREFMYVDDCADALVFILKHYSDDEHVNVGSGKDYTIQEIAAKVAHIVGFKGKLTNNTSMPDGTPRKLMASQKLLSLGWFPAQPLDKGLQMAYDWFLDNAVEA